MDHGSSPPQDVRHARASHRERLKHGHWMVGTVISSPDPVLAERAAREFDFVWVDLEHSALGIRDVQTLVIAIQGAGADALVRLPRAESELLAAVLDAGIDGVVAPKVDSVTSVERLVRALRFAPDGDRGFAPRRASAGMATASGLATQPRAACVIQIETRVALDAIDALAGGGGVDALVIGTADLSLDLGVPLDLEAPALIEAVRRIAAACAKAHVPWGIAAGALPDWVRDSRRDGAAVLTYSSDSRIYAGALAESARMLRTLAPDGEPAPGAPQ